MSSPHVRNMTRSSATPPRAVPTLTVQAEVAHDAAVPRLPTTVVSSWKGGVWKTAISASIAERLAFAGLDVLYLVTDDQLDARRRLGISESDPDVARDSSQRRFHGSVLDDVPLAVADDLQAGGVDDEVDRARLDRHGSAPAAAA